MNRMFIPLLALTLAAAPASHIAGCSGTTDRGVRYTLTTDRELEAFIAGDVPTVHEAARRVVVEQYRYRITQHNADAREGIVKALTAKGEEVRIETTYSSPRVSRINVFVGPLGDEPVMRELLSAVEDRSRILAQRQEVVSKAQTTKPTAPKSPTPKPASTTPTPAAPATPKPATAAPTAPKPATPSTAAPATATPAPTATPKPATAQPAAPAPKSPTQTPPK